ncbi:MULTISPECIES: TetR/AcrR family transcriptional regulator [Nocardiopsis]|uniref:TetR/AcrR family transcriptional regulator n=1 Tax=Nocardiopsis TaxID=2013 RepID=UPI000363DE84|nr:MULTISPECIES: TetR family transcriptional regulator [Nocardiopsis]PWV50133.1 TetR family transcriptional regulator [Nocardiopsis sp. L17-MgMaSL7]
MSSVPSEDLTARARVRDAAVACFGQYGFGVSVRTIADHAGVSPGLVIHHFGSKARLRQACDDHVRGVINELKGEAFAEPARQTFLQQLAETDQYAPVLGYVLHALQAGGPLAVSMYDLMVEDAERYIAVAEEAGAVRPSRDPAGRARWAVSSALGSLLLHVRLRHPGPDVDYRQVFHTWMAEHMLAVLEAYTEPVLADTSLLDAYLSASTETPPTTAPDTGGDGNDDT